MTMNEKVWRMLNKADKAQLELLPQYTSEEIQESHKIHKNIQFPGQDFNLGSPA